jgi:uncharacterized RDD family membrane protein YckC
MTTPTGSRDRSPGRHPEDDATTPEPGRANGLVFADVPNRLIGFLLDAVILVILSLAGAVAISAIFGPVVTIDLEADPQVSVDRGLALANAALGTGINAVYFIGFWRRLRGSPGIRMLRMRIGREADGGAISLTQGVVRWLFIGLPLGVEAFLTVLLSGLADVLLLIALLLWYLILMASTARSPTKQGFHDRIARTIVAKRARPVAWAAADRGHGGRVR